MGYVKHRGFYHNVSPPYIQWFLKTCFGQNFCPTKKIAGEFQGEWLVCPRPTSRGAALGFTTLKLDYNIL
jgi:hypothetical protein